MHKNWNTRKGTDICIKELKSAYESLDMKTAILGIETKPDSFTQSTTSITKHEYQLDLQTHFQNQKSLFFKYSL
jgi:hypothetical protein